MKHRGENPSEICGHDGPQGAHARGPLGLAASPWLVFAGLVLFVLGVALGLMSFARVLVLDPGDIEAGAGARYVVTLPAAPPLMAYLADGSDNTLVSDLKLSEDGKALGPAHALRSSIEGLGKGAYLHWGGMLEFSASDNTDPRTNGRRYEAAASVIFSVTAARGLRIAGGALLCVWVLAHLLRQGRRGSRLRGLLARLRPYAIQIVVTLALFFGAVEIWARLSLPSDKVTWPRRNDPVYGTSFEPNALVRWTNGLDFFVEARANAAGFLDRPFPSLNKPAGTCRIAIIGDSFIEAAQVPIAEKVQVRLEQLAEARWPGRDFETMALGYSGTGQANQLAYYDHFVKARRPDLVVLAFVNNDFANNSALLESVRNGWHPAHTPRPFVRQRPDGMLEIQPIAPDWKSRRLPRLKDNRAPLHRRLHDLSRFYRWFYKKLTLQYPSLARRFGGDVSDQNKHAHNLRYLAMSDPAFAQAFQGWNYPNAPDVDAVFKEADLPRAFAQALDYTAFAMDAFKQRSAEAGAGLVVLATYGVIGPLFERLKEITEPRGIDLLAQTDFIAAKGATAQDVHFRHDGHWNARGHQWAAEQLLGYMERVKPCGL